MEDRGWDQVDFVYVTGDAYVDHSSFGTAIISRLLEHAEGVTVGILGDGSDRGCFALGARASPWLPCKCRQYGFHG